jgi:hypothetical protein
MVEEEYYSTQPGSSLEYLLTCDVCQFTYKGENELAEHLKLHSKDFLHVDGYYQCCGNSAMPYHEAVEHFSFGHCEEEMFEEIGEEEGPPLKIYAEQKRGRKPSGLDKICYICNKEFRRPSDLERHMRVHTGNLLYPLRLGSSLCLR